MAEEDPIVKSLPDRPLTHREREAFEHHDQIQMVMSSQTRVDSERGEIMYGAMFIGEDWVTVVSYEENRGWEVIYQSEMHDNILADGFLRSEDLYDDHPIQEGMDALRDARTSDEDQ